MLVRQLLATAKRLSNSQELAKISYLGLSPAQTSALNAMGCKVYKGKVRDVIFNHDQAVLLHTDRLSAFDCFVGYVPFRGQILAMLTNKWSADLRSNGIPVAKTELIHPRALKTHALEPVKVEVVVRGYLAGNIMKEYLKGSRTYCGVSLPEGLSQYQKLESPIITPTTKAAAYKHDEPIDAESIINQGLCTKKEWESITESAFAAFSQGSKKYKEAGWLLADTKYEFGRTREGQLLLMDEIHTPDSSRLWEAESYEERIKQSLTPVMLDKEIARRWLVESGFTGQGQPPEIPTDIIIKLANAYINVAEAVLGESIGASLTAPDPVGLVSP